jgi:hypothetical protein
MPAAPLDKSNLSMSIKPSFTPTVSSQRLTGLKLQLQFIFNPAVSVLCPQTQSIIDNTSQFLPETSCKLI